MATAGGLGSPGRPVPLLYVLDQVWNVGGGTESQFLLLLSHLDRRQFAPTVVLLRGEDRVSSLVPDVPVEVLGVRSLKSGRFLQQALRLARRVRAGGFRIAHTFLNDAAIGMPPFLRAGGAKVVVSRRDLGFWYTRANLLALRALRPCVSAVLANSEAVKCCVVEQERYRPEQVSVIHNGLEARELMGRDEARRRLGIAPERAVLTVVANLRPIKRLADVVRAVAQLRAEFPGLMLQIVGEDPPHSGPLSHGAELRQLAAELGVLDSVSFVGLQSDPMPYVEAANVCLLCSQSEGLSNALLEYMWAGRPVVCTNVGGNPELIAHGRTGFLVDVGDVRQIAQGVRAALGAEGEAMGRRAREYAEQNFSARVMAQRHCEFYRRMLAARGTDQLSWA